MNVHQKFEEAGEALCPDKSVMLEHLYALFSPVFVHPYPDAQIEIAYADLSGSEKPDAARQFSAFKLEEAADFAEERNRAGFNVYVGASLKKARGKGQVGEGRHS